MKQRDDEVDVALLLAASGLGVAGTYAFFTASRSSDPMVIGAVLLALGCGCAVNVFRCGNTSIGRIVGGLIAGVILCFVAYVAYCLW